MLFRSGHVIAYSPVSVVVSLLRSTNGQRPESIVLAASGQPISPLAAPVFQQAALAGRRFFAVSTRGGVRYDSVAFLPEDVFVFGSESAGLPPEVLAGFPDEQRLRLPMQPGVRSINLSNTVAILAYEAWRQKDFSGGV